jgi:hypothetical protein
MANVLRLLGVSAPGLLCQKMNKVGELVVQLYAAWGKPDKAAEWRRVLAK